MNWTYTVVWRIKECSVYFENGRAVFYAPFFQKVNECAADAIERWLTRLDKGKK